MLIYLSICKITIDIFLTPSKKLKNATNILRQAALAHAGFTPHPILLSLEWFPDNFITFNFNSELARREFPTSSGTLN